MNKRSEADTRRIIREEIADAAGRTAEAFQEVKRQARARSAIRMLQEAASGKEWFVYAPKGETEVQRLDRIVRAVRSALTFAEASIEKAAE